MSTSGPMRDGRGGTQADLHLGGDLPIARMIVEIRELEGVAEADQAVIDERVAYRLARQPSAYVVLEIARPLVRRKHVAGPTALVPTLSTALLAGMIHEPESKKASEPLETCCLRTLKQDQGPSACPSLQHSLFSFPS